MRRGLIGEKKILKNPLILALEVIVQPLEKQFFIALILQFLAHCAAGDF